MVGFLFVSLPSKEVVIRESVEEESGIFTARGPSRHQSLSENRGQTIHYHGGKNDSRAVLGKKELDNRFWSSRYEGEDHRFVHHQAKEGFREPHPREKL